MQYNTPRTNHQDDGGNRRDPDEHEVSKLELMPHQKELLASVEWVSSDGRSCDLDLSCALLDSKGAFMEIIDFNNLRSNCGAVWSEGDVVGADVDGDGFESEEMSFDLKRINPNVHVIVLWVTSFKASLGSMQIAEVTVTLTNYVFAESADNPPGASSSTDWKERVIQVP